MLQTLSPTAPSVGIPTQCDAARRYPRPSDAQEYAFANCFGGRFYLINMNGGTNPIVGLGFEVSVGPVGIDGRITFGPTLVAGVIANLCLSEWKVRFGVQQARETSPHAWDRR